MGACVVALVVLAGVGWALVNRTAWAGPMAANALRSVLGPDRVARLEDVAYGVQDHINRFRRNGQQPKAYWVAAPVALAAGPSGGVFRVDDVGPMIKKFNAPGDGVWVPVAEAADAGVFYKTLLHPDPDRSWAEVFVFAIDPRQVQLHLVAGFQEPRSATPEALAAFRDRTPARAAVVPASDRDRLLAAFNGGFMAEHGHWGMRVNGITILPPKTNGCTVALMQDGTLRIRTFAAFGPDAAQAAWYRQTPPCMIERGKIHPALGDPDARAWGATLSGATIIRRSAIGLSADGATLFVAMGNATSARALALAMQHVGAVDVAQLDVNYSYPKILFYRKDAAGEIAAEPGVQGFVFTPGEYVAQRAMRDFFYLTRR